MGDKREFNVATVDPNATIRTEAPELPPLPQDAAPVPGKQAGGGRDFHERGSGHG